MKKLLIISIAVLGLGIVSCQKQEIAPNTDDLELPVWEENARIGDGGDNGSDDGTIGEITDPNNENDEPPSDDDNKTRDGDGDNREEGEN